VNKAIWKYQFNVEDDFFLEIPDGWEFLSVQLQNGVACMWLLVTPEFTKKFFHFRVIGTGHEHDSKYFGKYLGTFLTGPYVWHLFSGGE